MQINTITPNYAYYKIVQLELRYEYSCLPLENLKDKQLKMNIKLLIIKHKKGKEKGQEKGPTDQKRSLMDSGATLFVPQGNPKCEARV
jgi:hypothetical protein